jgi:MFS family permease
MSYNRKMVFAAACAGMLLFGICMITLGSVAAGLRAKLDLNEIEAATLFSILPLGILAGSMIFGPVADRHGYKVLLIISALFLFVGFEGLAFTGSSVLLRIFIFLIGLGGGAVNGATNALVADISDTEKGANISLLGVFYGIGALGMPLLLGLMKDFLSFEALVAAIGILTFISAIWFTIIGFPPPKQARGVPFSKTLKMAGDKVLLTIALFLCFQSGYEAIVNNWTTTFLSERLGIEQSQALFGLSSFVGGLVAMRLLIGSIFRKFTAGRLLIISFVLIITALVMLGMVKSLNLSVAGLILLGAGMSGGFPIMLGIAGNLYAEMSGTAFSFIFFIALAGNTVINLLMGVIAQKCGTGHLITFAAGITMVMMLLAFSISKNQEKHNNQH